MKKIRHHSKGVFPMHWIFRHLSKGQVQKAKKHWLELIRSPSKGNFPSNRSVYKCGFFTETPSGRSGGIFRFIEFWHWYSCYQWLPTVQSPITTPFSKNNKMELKPTQPKNWPNNQHSHFYYLGLPEGFPVLWSQNRNSETFSSSVSRNRTKNKKSA